ncbi:MAG: lysine--tRNA ligase, partial [Patescibacteria group bacterium]
MRSRIVASIREFLQDKNYIEVETPILHAIAGGALARPFQTHHHALDQDFYLRIAPELYLKRLMIGGFQKIFEIGRSFRNEGIDHTHNPEFTMLELYSAFETRDDLIRLTHELFQITCKKLYKKTKFEFQDKEIDFTKFKTISFNDAMERYASMPMYNSKTKEDILITAKRFGVNPEKSDTKSKIADFIFKKIVRPKLIQPTFLIDHPLEISPLAKKNPTNSETVLRFQYIVGGFELANGFSELNDPIDQAERFRAQEKLRGAGEGEAMSYDEDFVEALEYGMPPAAGLGIGIDRLVMLFTNTDNIKEVILFPTMRPKQ